MEISGKLRRNDLHKWEIVDDEPIAVLRLISASKADSQCFSSKTVSASML